MDVPAGSRSEGEQDDGGRDKGLPKPALRRQNAQGSLVGLKRRRDDADDGEKERNGGADEDEEPSAETWKRQIRDYLSLEGLDANAAPWIGKATMEVEGGRLAGEADEEDYTTSTETETEWESGEDTDEDWDGSFDQEGYFFKRYPWEEDEEKK